MISENALERSRRILIQHGYILLFAWVLIEQIGLPVPAVPLLIAASALAGSGKINLVSAMGSAIIAALLADVFWYHVGRYRGGCVLKLLCRISLEPDSCVRRTEDVFARHGAHSLLIAKCDPGLNTAETNDFWSAIWIDQARGNRYLFSVDRFRSRHEQLV